MLRETLAALQLKVTIGDTVHDVRLKPGDLVRLEDHTGNDLFAGEEAKFGMADLFFLAWCGLSRDGVVDGDFDAFLNLADDIDTGIEEKTGPLGQSAS